MQCERKERARLQGTGGIEVVIRQSASQAGMSGAHTQTHVSEYVCLCVVPWFFFCASLPFVRQWCVGFEGKTTVVYFLKASPIPPPLGPHLIFSF